MNITLATTQFFPDVYGGVETYTLSLATEFQRLGHTVHIVCTRRSASGDGSVTTQDDHYRGIPVRRIIYDTCSRPEFCRQILYDPTIAELAGQAFREWRTDIVHVTNFPGISAAVISVAKELGIPIVWTATDFGMTCVTYTLLKSDGKLCSGRATLFDCLDCVRGRSRRADWLYGLLCKLPARMADNLSRLARRMPVKMPYLFETAYMVGERIRTLLPLLKQIDLIIAPCAWMKEVLVMNGADPRHTVVSVYGLQQDHAAPSARTVHPPLRFAFVGRIHPIKGVEVLIDAFNQLPDPKGARLTIYGSSAPEQLEYLAKLLLMARSNPGITFMSQFDQQRRPAVFSDFDVLVVPSVWYENSPLAVLEGLYYRTPIIASDVDGIADLITDGRNGLLFRRGDARDLALKMQCLIDDPKLVERFSAQIGPVKSICQDAETLLEKYKALIA